MEQARKDFKCELNVPYGSTERAKYDVYGIDLPKGKGPSNIYGRINGENAT